ncbi:MAG: hypothetical protein Q9220_001500 [cf. Caloplaca sp. 1 TL-2023]
MYLSLLSLLFLSSSVLATPTTNDNGFSQMSTLSTALSKRQSLSPIRNELALCRPVTVIFARGTTEPGNVGTLTGPPFFNALDLAIGTQNVGVQGVPYLASIGGYLAGGDVGGSATLASLTKQAASQCPGTQIVLSGYSQGAQLVHNGAAQLTGDVAARVAAVKVQQKVLFGDPFDGRPFPNIDASKVKTFCFAEDLICKDTIVVDGYHLAYSVDAGPAAQFVKSKVRL